MLIRSRSRLRALCFASLLGAVGLTETGLQPVRAEFLFNGFLAPSFSTQYSAWDVFYTPYNNVNYPDYYASYGSKGTAPAGYTIPSNANPSNPQAYWDTRNPTITQTGQPGAFIIGAGVPGAGNIYSFSGPTAYVLNDGRTSATGLVLLQFQTDGTLLDFDSIKLRYMNGSGVLVNVSPSDLLREYRTSGSSFGGSTNRAAAEWNLTGLGVTSYQLVFNASSSSNSFQLAGLDTAPTYGAIIPPARSWNGTGSGVWSNGANWQQGTSSNENGNVRFVNAAATTVALDANHALGELRFATGANVTINPSGSYALTVNTGITNLAAATGLYTIGTAYQLGAYNIFDLAAGDVRLTGVVSGGYGLEKDGAGNLTLGGNNSFSGGVTVGGGILTISGQNTYTNPTQVLVGSLVVTTSGRLAATPVTVASGAIFINNGTVAGNVDVSGALGGAGTFGGTVTFESTGTFAGAGAFNGGLTVNQGANLALSSGTVVVRGAITNNGTLRFTKGATLDASGATSIYNNGTLDFLSGNLTLPTNVTITNGPNGRVLTSELLKVHNTVAKSGATITVRNDGYSGHTYQLQKSATLLNASYANVGAPQTVTTDTTTAANQLSFDDVNATGAQGFYRVQVDP